MLHAAPTFPTLPAPLRHLLLVHPWEAVTLGRSGAQVWRSPRQVLKVQERNALFSNTLHQEHQRLNWLAGRFPAPRLLAYETTATHEFLVMTRLAGVPLCAPEVLGQPMHTIGLLARTLHRLHALPLASCPFSRRLDQTLALAQQRMQAGLVDETDFDEAHQGRSAASLFAELVDTRPVAEDLVITHGDACLPNFMAAGGHLTGLIDLGRLGVADRHADLALAYRSARYNLGNDYGDALLTAYGRHLIDDQKITFYLLLDEFF